MLILKIRPIESVIAADLEEIKQVCSKLAEMKISKDETFRVTLERRFTDIARDDLITSAASNIDRKVDLKQADKIVFIEVLEDSVGISILSPEDVVSIIKEHEKRVFKKFEDQLKKD